MGVIVERSRSRVRTAVMRAAIWASAVALGAASALPAPYRFATDDAVSYLDVADAYRHGHWHAAINGYWSPLYSWVLALAGAIVKPSAASEILTMRVVNVVLFLLALAAFERLLGAVFDTHPVLRRPAPLALGYSAFLWSSLVWIGVRTDTPDMCAAACVYLAAALALPRSTDGHQWWRMFGLGGAAGAAYLTKTAMLPVGIALMAVGAIVPEQMLRSIARLACATAAFAVIAAPFIITLSHARHHFTVGETGTLNYAWHVYPTRRVIPNEHWQGDTSGFGTPTHPTRRLFTNPDVYGFDGPIDGTYPPWTDPSYWYEGLSLKFNAAAQGRVVLANMKFYAALFLPILVTFYLTVSWVGRVWMSVVTTIHQHWRLLIPAAIGLTLYLIGTDLRVADIATQPSSRFVAPFAVLLFVAMLAGVRLPDPSMSTLESLSEWTLALVIVMLSASTGTALVVAAAEKPVPWLVAERLHNGGTDVGDRVAILGRKYDRDHDHEFWARLARVHIVGHVPNDYAALRLPPDRWDALCAALVTTGARALIYKPPTDALPGVDWTPLTGGYYAYRLSGRPGE